MRTNGPIGGTGGLVHISQLTGVASSGGVTLTGSANAVATLGDFKVTNGGFVLTNKAGADLTVSGSLSAGTVALSAANINVTGSVSTAAPAALHQLRHVEPGAAGRTR